MFYCHAVNPGKLSTVRVQQSKLFCFLFQENFTLQDFFIRVFLRKQTWFTSYEYLKFDASDLMPSTLLGKKIKQENVIFNYFAGN